MPVLSKPWLKNFAAAVNLWLLVPGFLCLLLLSEINGALIHQLVQGRAFDPNNRLTASIHVQMALMVIGIVLVALGLCGKRVRFPRLIGAPASRRTLFMLVAITFVAFVMRAWNLENEVHSLIDEYNIVKSVNDLNANPTTPVLAPFDQIAAFPWVWSYVEKLATDTLGHTLAGLRIQSAIVGALTVLALYHLARSLFGVKVGLVAALFLATFPPHVHFSRLAMLLIMSPLFGTLALYCLVRALQTQAQKWYVLCGVMLGLLAYYDESGRLVFPMLVIVWLVWLWMRKHPRQATRAGALWIVLATVLISFPVYYTKLGYRAPLFPRLEQNAPQDHSLDWTTLLFSGNGAQNLYRLFNERLLPPFRHYISLPDTSELYYGGRTALVLPWLVPLFLVGIVFMFWRFGGFLLIVWVVGVALGNSLLGWNTWSARYMGAAPVLMLLTAAGLVFGIEKLSNSASQRFSISAKSVKTALYHLRFALIRHYPIFMLAVLLAFSQFIYYFGVHLPEYRDTIQPFPDYADVAFRIRELPPETRVFFVYIDRAYPLHFEPLFNFWGITPIVYSVGKVGVTRETLAELPTDIPYAYFLDQKDTETLALLKGHWRIVPPPQFSPYNIAHHRQYALYFFPVGAEVKDGKDSDE